MRLHEVIEAQRDDVIDEWLRGMRERLPRERPFTDEQLIDSLRLFLSELVAMMQAPDGTFVPSYMAQAHGGQRHVLGTGVDAVVAEYGILWSVLARRAGEEVSRTELAQLSTFLFGAAADAARTYAVESELKLRKTSTEHFAFVAHELRNPLQSARLAAEVLRRSNVPRAFDALERSLGQMQTMVDEALVRARVGGLRQGAPVNRTRLRLDHLAMELVDELGPHAQARNTQIVVDAKPLEGSADPQLMRSALGNLVRNALKFSPPGSTVLVKVAKQRELAQLSVRDQCGGLPPGKAEDLFAAFYQASDDRSGFGLGLAIAREAIEAHQGTLRVEDVPGQGCVFTLEFPLTT